MIIHIIVSYDQNISLIFYVKDGSHVRLWHPSCVSIPPGAVHCGTKDAYNCTSSFTSNFPVPLSRLERKGGVMISYHGLKYNFDKWRIRHVLYVWCNFKLFPKYYIWILSSKLLILSCQHVGFYLPVNIWNKI